MISYHQNIIRKPHGYEITGVLLHKYTWPHINSYQPDPLRAAQSSTGASMHVAWMLWDGYTYVHDVNIVKWRGIGRLIENAVGLSSGDSPGEHCLHSSLIELISYTLARPPVGSSVLDASTEVTTVLTPFSIRIEGVKQLPRRLTESKTLLLLGLGWRCRFGLSISRAAQPRKTKRKRNDGEEGGVGTVGTVGPVGPWGRSSGTASNARVTWAPTPIGDGRLFGIGQR
ncbi:hypothetical protein DFP72DRAFT_846866 [Ephemerocybe angulata]|uniref:Uncharacterized protein n=1 Tax=Ephemerocybe angulata TaxID=980116 RepID=A0A8H6M7R0_9AGAR|nr:hypothetical protein DFP72DRAFT_846866 [Tulosesus angulatus]